MKFQLTSPFKPTGDQPSAITELTAGLKKGFKEQTLLGVTGSGKTFTMANVIQKIQRPTLVISHNKTLAAQLASEFQDFFPKNAIHYFVSYYDYYQPEAYVPRTDTFIEKETSINEEIDRLRHASTQSLLSRRDVVIVASVSCIYGLGSPKEYKSAALILKQGETVEIFPSFSEHTFYRLRFFGDKLEKIEEIDSLTMDEISAHESVDIYPATHYLPAMDNLDAILARIRRDLNDQVKKFTKANKPLEAERLAQRTNFDLDMIKQTGFCSGIENYSRYFDGRAPSTPPYTLIDFFPKDFLLFIDESHMTLPQVKGMYEGDKARKTILVDYGFRLPAALDNRPLNFDEFRGKINQVVYVSATPDQYELKRSQQVAEQLIRPTGLLDPNIEVRPTKHQIDDLMNEIQKNVKKKQRVIVTTLTKRMAEDLSDYLEQANIKVHYLHSEIDTFERLEILRDLRLGTYDVVVGINLLREGLDLPEVSLIAILDADKEGFLRSYTALMQVMGRAARHVEGRIVMYADRITGSMQKAINETIRRRRTQEEYNRHHGITPTSIKKAIRESRLAGKKIEVEKLVVDLKRIPKEELPHILEDLRNQMDIAAKNLEFEKAAALRDEISALKDALGGSIRKRVTRR
ncbi:MAG: UvrABC system protein B [Parcubacteria group bacterium GW2011_GWA2_48_9]|nr:MAG: UvrABC system protein B [Parcubacteria group bacterium GW2011_GWA2_48_9]